MAIILHQEDSTSYPGNINHCRVDLSEVGGAGAIDLFSQFGHSNSYWQSRTKGYLPVITSGEEYKISTPQIMTPSDFHVALYPQLAASKSIVLVPSCIVKPSLVTVGTTDNFISLLYNDIRPRLALPSLYGYETTLTGFQDSTAHIKSIEDLSYLSDKSFTNGVLVFRDRPDMPISLSNISTREIISPEDIDLALLAGIYSIAFHSAQSVHGNFITIKRSQLANYLGFNHRGINGFPIIERLSQFSGVIGILPDGGFYKLLDMSSYDPATDMITLDCAFFFKMIQTIHRDASKTIRRNGQNIPITLPTHNFLWHPTSIATRNKNAWLLGLLITDLVLQAGAKGVPHIRFKNLIQRVPTFWNQLKSQAATKDKNIVLKRTFDRMYGLIHEKSDAYHYWLDLQIPRIIPTVSRLNDTLTIHHKGINPDYSIDSS